MSANIDLQKLVYEQVESKKTGWLLDDNMEKLYANSHISCIRVNDDYTLAKLLEEHYNDGKIHILPSEREDWNKVSNKLDKTDGGIVLGNVEFRGKRKVIHINSGAGSTGYVKVASIVITGSYADRPLEFTISRRHDNSTTRISIMFNSADNSNPTLGSFKTFGATNDVYLYKESESTWSLIIKKTEAYDTFDILDYFNPDENPINVSWNDSFISSLPNGSIKATWGYNIGASESATKLTISNVGSSTKPVYFYDGVPKECSYSLETSVPSDAKFTDTIYTLPNATQNVLGGVRIGSNISVTNGTISILKDNVTSALGYTPSATDTNTWRGIQDNLTSQSDTDSLSAKQGYYLANGSARDDTKIPLSGSKEIGGDLIPLKNNSVSLGKIQNKYSYLYSSNIYNNNYYGDNNALNVYGGISYHGNSSGITDFTGKEIYGWNDYYYNGVNKLSIYVGSLLSSIRANNNNSLELVSNNTIYINSPNIRMSSTPSIPALKVGEGSTFGWLDLCKDTKRRISIYAGDDGTTNKDYGYIHAYNGLYITAQSESAKSTSESGGTYVADTDITTRSKNVNMYTWGGSVYVNTAIVQTSSKRYKTNIVDITEEKANKLLSLRPVEFDYKEWGNHGLGLIAEETYEILPEIVSFNNDNEIEGISYNNLFALLIKEIQILNKRIEKLEENK